MVIYIYIYSARMEQKKTSGRAGKEATDGQILSFARKALLQPCHHPDRSQVTFSDTSEFRRQDLRGETVAYWNRDAWTAGGWWWWLTPPQRPRVPCNGRCPIPCKVMTLWFFSILLGPPARSTLIWPDHYIDSLSFVMTIDHHESLHL